MIDRLCPLVDRGPEALRECRVCGTAVGDDAAACPACGSTEVATYEL